MNTKIFRGLVAVAVIAIMMCVSSCVKDDIVPPLVEESILRSNEEGVSTRALSSFSTGSYSILQKYKNAYVHINQYDNYYTSETYPTWPNNTSNPQNCSWSNYVMAVGCVGRASSTISSNDYKLDKARALKGFMYTSRNSYYTGSVMAYIYADYGLVYDNSNRVGLRHWTTSKSTSNHNVIAEELLAHLNQYKTPMVIIGTTASGAGHYFTIVSIVWGGNIDNSDIWVCDSTQGSSGDSFDSVKSSIPFRTFLNRVSNGSDSDYVNCNVLFTYDLNP
ncbi:MAG: hypothetical protein LBD75_01300 [Candidatus Peribacteria bacterium]|jgi:hypothetical protein|nr:hypothetical protein [Candidatus Peribacteria bacterium]